MDETVVLLALDQLADAHLLVEAEVPAEPLSRRVALRRIGVAAAVVLPLVTSIVAPTAAQAVSCLHNGQPCVVNGQCCSGICLGAPTRCVGG